MNIAEFLEPTDTRHWTILRQVGVEHAISTLDRTPNAYGNRRSDAPWDLMSLQLLRHRYEEAGFALAGIEDSPPLDRVRLDRPGAEEELEAFEALVRNMGRAGIPMLCYNWMAVIPWTRTSVRHRERGGALVSGFERAALPDDALTYAGEVPEELLWSTLRRFLERVVPVAEEAGVRLALHPDDPPLSPLRGVGRIVTSLDALQHVLGLVDSPCNALTLCQGNVTLMTDDVPGAIRRFGNQGRIAFGHFRDVRGTPEAFVETFHDNGPTDMLACMRAWHDIGFDGVLRPDHVPTLDGESNDRPSYAYLARLHAIGYMTGLREAARARGRPTH